MARKNTARRCRCADLEARLARVEELARSNRRELDIQFQRIADLQAMFDSPMAERRRRKSDKLNPPDGKANGKGRAIWPDGDGFR
jgi:hypothetical protein